jgi:Protein of unknown function (DUF3987)
MTHEFAPHDARLADKVKIVRLDPKALEQFHPRAPFVANVANVAWPALDEVAYYGLAGEVVRAIEPHSEADPVALLAQFLTMAGNAIGREPYFLVEANQHHGNLFCVVVGDSSKARKGTSFGRIRDLVKYADENWSDAKIKGGLSSGEGLIHEIRDEIQKYDAKNRTTEVTDPGIADKRLLLFESEFSGALATAVRHGNTLTEVIRRAWDGETLQTLTKNSPTRATRPHVSIIGHITIDELRARLCQTDLVNGFANRFLFVLARRSKKLPFGGNMSGEFASAIGERIKAAVANVKHRGRLNFDDEAAALWARLYEHLSEPTPGLLGAVIARAEAQTLRLALIYALLDGSETIKVPHLQAAVALWEYCEASATYIFGTVLGDPVADEILRALQARPGGS